MRKPNYSQERAQRERDKAAKTRAKEQKKQDQKAAELAELEPNNSEDRLPEPLDPAVKG
ncbi:hypothetical protein HVPorG_03758 [Roseomonas mucosa]|uniref:Uncharacterized protein n=1 Tax=Roseomonas mucosa TaxID=207340 RepID=A0A4Y1N3V7_9PROT|nr:MULTISPECIES: hypothetical protein [Roseomonas]AWV24710.1 hypothetical protein RADP37_03758 [Roseomonas mucosa]MDT8277654.1 hypothetical protein [Roseomonas mucosa]MDT8353864.1 hypothetical protein [Roseomonas mucosa]QDJ11542.1 hypothetical protein HVPorG_03758 [Roseomonas mucosa]USQ72879.1 hypothetical protein NF552_06770 [Roseomonas mucosa]